MTQRQVTAAPINHKDTIMTEQQLHDRISNIKSLADAEKLVYESTGGRLSRSDCKHFVGKLSRLVKAEKQQTKQATLKLWQAAAGFFPAILGKR